MRQFGLLTVMQPWHIVISLINRLSRGDGRQSEPTVAYFQRDNV